MEEPEAIIKLLIFFSHLIRQLNGEVINCEAKTGASLALSMEGRQIWVSCHQSNSLNSKDTPYGVNPH